MMGMMKRYFFERRTISEGPDAETRERKDKRLKTVLFLATIITYVLSIEMLLLFDLM